jgi:hypothetical protein
MEKRLVKTKMKNMTKSSDGKRSGMCQFHAISPVPAKLWKNELKWHEVTLSSYYYIHMIPEGTLGPIFARFKYRS